MLIVPTTFRISPNKSNFTKGESFDVWEYDWGADWMYWISSLYDSTGQTRIFVEDGYFSKKRIYSEDVIPGPPAAIDLDLHIYTYTVLTDEVKDFTVIARLTCAEEISREILGHIYFNNPNDLLPFPQYPVIRYPLPPGWVFSPITDTPYWGWIPNVDFLIKGGGRYRNNLVVVGTDVAGNGNIYWE